MKFDVGYQLYPDNYYVDEIVKRKDSISEVYFSWGDFPNGRNNQIDRKDMYPWECQNKQIEDLKKISSTGIDLNVLFNATCYGEQSLSNAFYEKIGATVDYISENFGLKTVTTTSPVIASFIKKNFENVKTRLSVNVGVESISSMEYMMDFFDGFYLKRELNRNFSKIKELKNWCDASGKTLYMLANSGCLNHCTAHVFHDNLVSHESQTAKMDNGFSFGGVCHNYLREKKNLENYFSVTGFVRPEDIHLYEEYFTSVKLATRANVNPVKVLYSYIDRKSFYGNIMELLEPNHSSSIYPYIIENSQIESEITAEEIKYKNIKKALVSLEDTVC